jgi:hypothetical protein
MWISKETHGFGSVSSRFVSVTISIFIDTSLLKVELLCFAVLMGEQIHKNFHQSRSRFAEACGGDGWREIKGWFDGWGYILLLGQYKHVPLIQTLPSRLDRVRTTKKDRTIWTKLCWLTKEYWLLLQGMYLFLVTWTSFLRAAVRRSDTTSTALANLWYFLLRNPSCYTRLRQEVDEAFPSSEDPVNQHKLATMRYLNACM